MVKAAVEHLFTGATTPISSYDSTKTNLGLLIQQRTGVSDLEKFAGPMPIGLFRPVESTAAIPGINPHPIQWSSTIDWLFLSDNAAAAPTRRIQLVEFDKSTSTFTFKGFITLTFPPSTNHTIRGFRIDRTLHTVGTVAVSGTGVTGTSTSWQTDRCPVGCRIGFGSTDPTQITTWYEISAIGNDTSITLTASAGTIGAGSAYVIEDLRAIVSTTNATATNGGLFVAKGLRYELFIPGGTTISAASTTDQIRAVYWVADAATVTNTAAAGVAIEPQSSKANHYVYVLNGASTTCRIFKYDVRVALTSLSSGKSTSGLVLQTGDQTLTGNQSQANNGRIATLSHGPGSGVASLYWVTTTRVYRAPIASITAASTTFATDAMTEVPPGGTNTYAATGALSSIEVAGSLDRLVVMSTGASGNRSYVTKYNTTADQFDHIWLVDDKQNDQSLADSSGTPHPAIIAGVFSVWVEGGVAYLSRVGTTAATNLAYAVPIGAHWAYAASTNERLITPAISTPGATKYYRVYVNETQQIGSATFGLPPEPYRVYYRTSGISDNSGSWTLLDDTKTLTGIAPASSIQFMFEFKVIGAFCIPARIHSLTLVYDSGDDIPSELRWNLGDSNSGTGVIGFIQTDSFGGAVPALEITYYRADNQSAVLVQDSDGSDNGTFEYWDGDSWDAGLGPDTIGTRRRFTPTAGLPTGVNVYAKLALA